MLKKPNKKSAQTPKRRRGSAFVEYILLVSIVGIGVIVGLATVKSALINELDDLADAIEALS